MGEDKLQMLLYGILRVVENYEKEIHVVGGIVDIVEGPDKGKRAVQFMAKGYEELGNTYLPPSDVCDMLEELEETERIGEEEYKQVFIALRNKIAKQLLEQFVPAIKQVIAKKGAGQKNVKPYHEAFDHALVDYFQKFFMANRIGIQSVESQKVDAEGMAFNILVETNNGIRVRTLYLKPDESGIAQLQIMTVYVPEELRGYGLSKMIINNLFVFCYKTNADLLITQVINAEWEMYLLTKCAQLVHRDAQKGDTLAILKPL
ncbi:MAG: hypothetical protein IKO10_12935 [Lachnospiraceae bacterium]|nr:hypothetical protein [Lachnospiraceae bacterium]